MHNIIIQVLTILPAHIFLLLKLDPAALSGSIGVRLCGSVSGCVTPLQQTCLTCQLLAEHSLYIRDSWVWNYTREPNWCLLASSECCLPADLNIEIARLLQLFWQSNLPNLFPCIIRKMSSIKMSCTSSLFVVVFLEFVWILIKKTGIIIITWLIKHCKSF